MLPDPEEPFHAGQIHIQAQLGRFPRTFQRPPDPEGPFDNLPERFQLPQKPPTYRQPNSKPRRTLYQALSARPTPTDDIHEPSTSNWNPKEPAARSRNASEHPENPSAKFRTGSRLRRALQRTIPTRPSPQGTHQQTQEPLTRPEGHITDSSTLRAPRNPSLCLEPPARFRRTTPKTSNPDPSPKEHEPSFKLNPRPRRTSKQTIRKNRALTSHPQVK